MENQNCNCRHSGQASGEDAVTTKQSAQNYEYKVEDRAESDCGIEPYRCGMEAGKTFSRAVINTACGEAFLIVNGVLINVKGNGVHKADRFAVNSEIIAYHFFADVGVGGIDKDNGACVTKSLKLVFYLAVNVIANNEQSAGPTQTLKHCLRTKTFILFRRSRCLPYRWL